MTERKLEVLNLVCEWEECYKQASEIEDFISHIIVDHLFKLCEDDLRCQWKDCEGFTENLPELRRHILLHAFHTKIKWLGRTLQIRKGMSDCTLSNHSRNIIPELPEPLICLWEECSEVFECPEYFYRHVDYHSEVDKGKEILCSWQGCSRKFSDQHKLKDHLRSHTQEKLVACPTCGGMFSSRTKFFDHIQRQLPLEELDPDSVFVCDYCSRKMSSERLLRDHMRHHVNHYKCMYCDMTCPTPSALQLHVTYRHSENKPHACMYCEYRCKSENDLRKHMETHSLISSYKCPVEGCSYTSRSQLSYNTHYRKMHEGKAPARYSCHLCEKICTRGNYLTKHLINYHKFKWPSGHCRFRYTLHEDGLYRLQTVRYESLELTETMMCDENVDDPSTVANNASENGVGESNSVSTDQPLASDNTSITSSDSAIVPGPVLPSDDGNRVQLQMSAPVIDNTLASQFVEESEDTQEPILISIVDAEGKTSENGGSLLLIKTTHPVACDQRRSVQLITKDSSGKMLLETAEIITQYEETSSN